MKKYLKLICIIPLIIAISFFAYNYKFIKSYYRYLVNNNVNISFSIFTKTITNDTFFSVPLGKRVLEEGFKTDDILTWHKYLKFNNDRWLFNVIIYLIYKLWGIQGIVNSVTIFTILIGILLFLVMKNRTNNTSLSLFGMLLAMYFSRNVFYSRAQILSFPLFIIEFFALEKLVETGKKRFSVITILSIILIANIHASVYPICWILFLPYFAEYIFSFFKDKMFFNKFEIAINANINIIVFTFIFALLAGLLTPTGFAPYTILYRAVLYTDTSFIGECQPSNLYNNLPLFLLIGASLIIMILPKIRIKVRDFFFITGFGIMGILVFRGTYFFHFISSVSVLRLIKDVTKEYKFGLQSRFVRYVLYISLTLIISTLCLKHFLFIQRDDFIPENSYPIGVVDYILKNVDYDNMKIFNSFNYGSYLEFRGIKSFIDSRSEVFTEEFNPGCTVLEDWLKMNSSNYREIFDKYEITHCIVNSNTKFYSVLELDKNYNKIYEDKYFTLFEKCFDN